MNTHLTKKRVINYAIFGIFFIALVSGIAWIIQQGLHAYVIPTSNSNISKANYLLYRDEFESYAKGASNPFAKQVSPWTVTGGNWFVSPNTRRVSMIGSTESQIDPPTMVDYGPKDVNFNTIQQQDPTAKNYWQNQLLSKQKIKGNQGIRALWVGSLSDVVADKNGLTPWLVVGAQADKADTGEYVMYYEEVTKTLKLVFHQQGGARHIEKTYAVVNDPFTLANAPNGLAESSTGLLPYSYVPPTNSSYDLDTIGNPAVTAKNIWQAELYMTQLPGNNVVRLDGYLCSPNKIRSVVDGGNNYYDGGGCASKDLRPIITATIPNAPLVGGGHVGVASEGVTNYARLDIVGTAFQGVANLTSLKVRPLFSTLYDGREFFNDHSLGTVPGYGILEVNVQASNKLGKLCQPVVLLGKDPQHLSKASLHADPTPVGQSDLTNYVMHGVQNTSQQDITWSAKQFVSPTPLSTTQFAPLDDLGIFTTVSGRKSINWDAVIYMKVQVPCGTVGFDNNLIDTTTAETPVEAFTLSDLYANYRSPRYLRSEAVTSDAWFGEM